MSNHSSEEKHWHSYSTTCIRPVPQVLRGFVAYWSMTTTDLVGLHPASCMELIVDQGSRQVPVTCSINCQPGSFYVQPIWNWFLNARGFYYSVLLWGGSKNSPTPTSNTHPLTIWLQYYLQIPCIQIEVISSYAPSTFDVTNGEGALPTRSR